MQKRIFIIVSCAVLLIALIVGAVFLIKTRNLTPESKEIDVSGTWRVYEKGLDNPGESYFVFADGTVRNFRDHSATASFESAYSIVGSIITIDKLGQDFSIERKTDGVLLLYNKEKEYLIVKTADNSHLSTESYSRSDFYGKYRVNLHANNVFGEEVITFDGDKFICVRNGQEFLNTTFSVNDGRLSLVTANGTMDLQICYNDVDTIRLVEKNSAGEYLAWELVLIEE